MTVNETLLRKALSLHAREEATLRTAVEQDVLMDRFVAEFVAESESLEGHDSKAAEVLNASRDLAGV